MNYIAICFCNKYPDFTVLLNQLVVYLLTCSETEKHTMDLLYLLKESFKKSPIDSLITGRSIENLSYLSSCLLSQRWRLRRIRSNVLRGRESDLACTKVSGVVSQHISRSGSFWDPLSSSMFKNKRIFLLVISKLTSTFSLWLYSLV